MDRSRFRPASPLAQRGMSRRCFVQGLSAGVLVAPGVRALGWAAADAPPAPGDRGVLTGTDLNLEIGALAVNFTGRQRSATAVNGQVPGPLLRWREGDTITLRVVNRLPTPTSIHWHGVIVPADMDGVPGLSFHGIAPGEAFVYRFQVNQSGTYWYHSHSRFQEQTGLYGPIVIEPRAGERQHADREHVVLLSDWTDVDPERIYRTLKLLAECGLASEVAFHDGLARYEHQYNRRSHHHMVCTECGSSVEFFSPEVDRLEQEFKVEGKL